MQTIELFSASICPFAHRCRLALAEKELDYKLIDIDLKKKPDWFLQMAPSGSVPVLRQGSFVLQESLIINEYINDLREDPALLPKSPQKRARARFWMDFFGSEYIPAFYRLLRAAAPEERREQTEKMCDVLHRLNQSIVSDGPGGNFWLGEQISLVDIACYPWFERWTVLEHFREFSLPGNLPELHRWIDTMRARDSVKRESQSADFYISAYADYATGQT